MLSEIGGQFEAARRSASGRMTTWRKVAQGIVIGGQ
jgi:hypothetical protein